MLRVSMLGKLRRPQQDVWTEVVFANLGFVILLPVLAYFGRLLAFQTESMIFFLSLTLLLMLVWVPVSWLVVTGSLFNPYTLFFIAAVLFNGGQALLDIIPFGKDFHANDYGAVSLFQINVENKFSPEIYLQTLFLVTLGLAAFHTGGLLSTSSYQRTSSRREAEEEDKVLTVKVLRLVAWGLLAVSLVPFLLLIRGALTLVWTSGYFVYLQDFGEAFPAALRILAFFIVPACLFLLAGSKNIRSNIAISALIVLVYSSTLIFVGARQQAAMLLIGFAWIYHRCIRPLPQAVLLIAGSFMLFIVFPIVSAVREVSGERRFSLGALLDALFSIQNPIFAIISEMGYTMMTVAYTINLVPSYRDFDVGRSYAWSLFSIFPNLFWETNPASIHAALDDWLVQTLAPTLANLGAYSFGYSFIAEAYLNFGWFGTPIALGIMGYLLGRLVVWADGSADPAKIAMVGSFTSYFLIYARGESLEVVRLIVYYAFVPYLGVCVLRALMRQQLYAIAVRFRDSYK
jgi:oligosaccharide repeat unit polymerase